MEKSIVNWSGKDTGAVETLHDGVFAIEPNDHAIWLDVRRIQAAGRQGTHQSKERSETAGSTRKLYRQKGTGGARAGDAKSPIRRSGGTIFGPRPRSYDIKINRKTQQLARRSALSYKASQDAVIVVEPQVMEQPSTKTVIALVNALHLVGKRVLIVTPTHDPALYKSATNAHRVEVREAVMVSTLDIVKADAVVLVGDAATVITGVLAPNRATV
jgi:large subunit ribosomal protein L4